MLRTVYDGRLFGFIDCDLHMPNHLQDNFGEMSPIFCNVGLGRDHLYDYMRAHAKETGELK